MKITSNTWTKFAVAGLAIFGATAFMAGPSAFAADPQELQMKGQPVSKLTATLGEPQAKEPLPGGGQRYVYASEHVLKGGHIMSGQPRGKAMSQDMIHRCRAEFDVGKDGVVRNAAISGAGCPKS